jgi:hypothetical protein
MSPLPSVGDVNQKPQEKIYQPSDAVGEHASGAISHLQITRRFLLSCMLEACAHADLHVMRSSQEMRGVQSLSAGQRAYLEMIRMS